MSAAVSFLEQLWSFAPSSSALSLASQQLSHAALTVALPAIRRFKQVQELDLSHNQLQQISGLEDIADLVRLVSRNARAHRGYCCLLLSRCRRVCLSAV
jgi:Leucine-rich repeat (LRR) protein